MSCNRTLDRIDSTEDGQGIQGTSTLNSFTEEDKSDEGWDKVAAERELSNTKRGFIKLEEPKFDVTMSMSQKNFSDCWAQVGRQPLKTTCQ